MKPYLEKNPSQKNRAGGVAQGEEPEFKPQYCKKKKKIYIYIYICHLGKFGLIFKNHRS
jgi:hypothetical protein